MLIRKNDMVIVLSGRDAGQQGRVLEVNRAKNKVVVEGVNRVLKHVKRSARNPQVGDVEGVADGRLQGCDRRSAVGQADSNRSSDSAGRLEGAVQQEDRRVVGIVCRLLGPPEPRKLSRRQIGSAFGSGW